MMKIVQKIVSVLMDFRRFRSREDEDEDEDEDEMHDEQCISSRTINLLSPGCKALGIGIAQDFATDRYLFYKKDDIFIGSLNPQELQDPRGSFGKIRKMVEQYEENREKD